MKDSGDKVAVASFAMIALIILCNLSLFIGGAYLVLHFVRKFW
jgi:hypothetical protein